MKKGKTAVYKIIDELCKEMDIEVESLSFGLIRTLKKENKIRNIIRYRFDLNSVISFEIANDKYATFELLKNNDIPIISHHMFFNPNTRKDYVTSFDLDIAKELFEKYNEKIVIKANDSCQGKEVFLIDKKENIEEFFIDLFGRGYDSLSLCPFEKIKNEYRVIVLDNECLFSYKKELPKIIGDGIKSIEDYVIDLNIAIPDKRLDLEYVPKKGEECYLSWKFNLSGGAIPKEIEDLNKKEKIEEIAKNASKAINIRFASVDIIENENCELKVMEINATVCMNKFTEKFENGYEIAKEIYRKAMKKMFE